MPPAGPPPNPLDSGKRVGEDTKRLALKEEDSVTEFDRLLSANQAYRSRHLAIAKAEPTRRLAVLTCMDARIDPLAMLGLAPGEAHVLRNAGSRVTEDVIRSLAVSEQALGTTAVLVLPHTGCGMIGLDAGALRAKFDAPEMPAIDFLPISDLKATLLADLRRLRQSPWIAGNVRLYGAILDLAGGGLDWVGEE